MENPAGLMSRRPKNLGSRIYHCLLAVAFLFLLILALSSLGNTAVTYSNVKEKSIYGKDLNGRAGTCILYADYPCERHNISPDSVCLSDDPACQFAITGCALMALVALVLIVLSLVKVALGFAALSALVLIDLVIVIPAFLVGLASSGVISAGLSSTCDAIKDYAKNSGQAGIDPNAPPPWFIRPPRKVESLNKLESLETRLLVDNLISFSPQLSKCCSAYVPKNGEFLTDPDQRMYFYEALDAAQITSWAATGLLFTIMVIDIVVVVVYAVRRSMRHTLAGYIPAAQEDVPTDPHPYMDEDELPDVTAGYS